MRAGLGPPSPLCPQTAQHGACRGRVRGKCQGNTRVIQEPAEEETREQTDGRLKAGSGQTEGADERPGGGGETGGHYLVILQVGSETILSADHRADPDLVPAGPPHVG